MADVRVPAADEDNLLWVDVDAADEADVDHVVHTFGLDPRTVDIIQRTNRRPLVRVFRDHFVVVALALDVHEHREQSAITVIEIDIVVGQRFLVSCHRRAHPLPFSQELETRIANPYIGQFHAAYLLFILLDTLVGHYAREFDEVENAVENLEERMLTEPGRDALDRTTLMKRHVLALRRLISPHREAFGVLIAADVPYIQQEDVEVYFRDLLGHLDDFVDRIDHARDVLTGAYNLYISNISQRTNQELRVLTFLSAVLLPMSVVTGIFGTNFALSEYSSWQPFYLMLAGLACLALGMLIFFRWRRWL